MNEKTGRVFSMAFPWGLLQLHTERVERPQTGQDSGLSMGKGGRAGYQGAMEKKENGAEAG